MPASVMRYFRTCRGGVFCGVVSVRTGEWVWEGFVGDVGETGMGPSPPALRLAHGPVPA